MEQSPLIWCEVCEASYVKAELKVWTGDDRLHYLCPGCDSDLLPIEDLE